MSYEIINIILFIHCFVCFIILLTSYHHFRVSLLYLLRNACNALQNSLTESLQIALNNMECSVSYTAKIAQLSTSQGTHDKLLDSTLKKLVEKITKSNDDGKYRLGIFIDIKKAFDTIDHNISLQKLHLLGVRGVANSWLTSYLSK